MIQLYWRNAISRVVGPDHGITPQDLQAIEPKIRKAYSSVIAQPPGYARLPTLGYKREVLPSMELKLPHLVASLLKRWLLGTYQGAVRPTHLAYYLDEFTFRFNRRASRQRGKLFYRLIQQALIVDPVPENELRAEFQPEENPDDLEL